MSQVAATAGYTTAELNDETSEASKGFKRLRDTAIELGSTTAFSATEAAEGLNILKMAGLDVDESISGIPHVLNLAAAGAVSMADSAAYTTGAVKGFADSMDNAQFYTDLIAKGATLANTSVGQLGEALSGASATAASYGQTADSVTVALLRLAEQQVVGTEATTALRRVYADLYTPTSKAKKALDELKISTYDEKGQARELNTVIDELNYAMSGMTDAQKNATASTIFTTWGLQAFNKMTVSSSEKVQEFRDGLNNAFGSAAQQAATQQAATQLDNLTGDITLFKSALEGLQIVISDSLNPFLREFAQFGSKAMDELRKGFQSGGVSGFMDALSGIITDGVKMLAEKAPDFIHVGKSLIFSVLEGFLGAKDEIFNAANTIMIDLTSALYSIPMHYGEELREVGTGIIELVAKGFSRAGDAISAYIGDFVPLIAQGFLTYHETLFTVGLDILGAIGRGIIDNKDEIQRIASDTIANMVTAIRDNAPAIIEGGIALINALAGAIIENLPLIMETGAEIITQLILGINTSLPALAVAAGAIIPYIAKIIDVVTSIGGVVNNVVGLVSDGIGTVMNIGGKLMGGIQALFALIAAHPIIAIIAGIIAAVTWLWTHCEAFRDAVGKIWETITGFFESAWKAISDLWNGAGKFFSDIVTDIKKAFDGIVGFFDRVFSDAWDAVKKAWNGTRTFFEEKWEDISGAFKGAKDKFIEIGGNIVGGLKEGIKDKWENFKGFLGTKVGGIIDSAKSKLGIHSPSKVFAGIGENMALGLAEGWGGEYDNIKRQIERGLSFGTANIGVDASGLSYGNAGTTHPGNFQPITIIVQPILNEKVIGEASYKYMLDRERAYGGRW